MLRIRDAQLEAFVRASVEDFLDRAVTHVELRMPSIFARQGEKEVRAMAQTALRKSHKYGITGEGDILRILNCMCFLGIDFDEDPNHPWALRILNRKDIAPAGKIAWLMQEAIAAEAGMNQQRTSTTEESNATGQQ